MKFVAANPVQIELKRNIGNENPAHGCSVRSTVITLYKNALQNHDGLVSVFFIFCLRYNQILLKLGLRG